MSDGRVDNARFKSDRTLLQYEIVLWDPEEILRGYATGSDYNNAPSLTDHASVAFVHDLARRRQEIQDFLGLGRLLVILLPAPERWYVATGERRNEGTAAKPRIKRIVDEVTTEEILPLPLDLVKATGEGFTLVSGPPFSNFWRAVGEQFYFHAYLKTIVGTPLLRMAGTDRAVAALTEAHGGTVLLLPQLGVYEPDIEDIDVDEDHPEFEEKWEVVRGELEERYHAALVDALLDLHSELSGASDAVLPAWTSDYQLPGEAEAVLKTTAAEEKLGRAQRSVQEAQTALATLQRWKGLVTSAGNALEAGVRDALTELGCSIEGREPHRTDLVFSWNGQVAVMEIKGLTKSSGERDAAQLEKWVSEYTLEHDVTPKGILAVNAWRELPLRDRVEPAFPDQMLKYSANRGHCLVETTQILAAVMTCTTKRAKSDFLARLFETVGVLDGYGWETALTYTETNQ